MFSKLTNEAFLKFTLHNEGPLLINSGQSAKIQPRPDMSFVRTVRNGEETVYLPGSSIKGVFRSRYEQVMRAIGQEVCDTFDYKGNQTCKKKIEEEIWQKKTMLNGKERYIRCCEACKLFGTLALGSRITFFDAYPIGKYKMGMRHGVGIDRITGAAHPGALYDIETLDDGEFFVKCKITNFKIYQLRIILWILEDINEGLVTFGMGGSRGNGQMRISNNSEVELTYLKYSDDAPIIDGQSNDALFGTMTKISGFSEMLTKFNINTKDELTNAIIKGW